MDVNRILCCVDFSSNADHAFESALDLAQKYGAALHLVHVLPPVISPLITDIDLVVPPESSTALVDKLADQMIQTYGLRVPPRTDHVVRVLEGHVSSEILHYIESENIDLVIVGAYGLSGVELVLFGSVAKRIAHKATCSVMIVRNPPEP
ncbi:Nucleotide-binding universal stress protein, UspA family [Desulfocicer vacuolatum DSM 3385]|uniref:Nucleotide-binding universal stress protein, UspA family n=1 Tax=Desulfocicer vacuolatum DSM 3385 TaxID=1121400 RepID=A0A1W1ZCW7_9BACT|nr:universal stress protein [Desulfocicer vacuolatum]SMC46122.1 Nucleotide-binding universal stress protein, UspA family [Desulfocicer vacuolatum DSM 3385]